MKDDYSLNDLKNKKCKSFFLKNSSQIEFDFFFSKLPYETRASLFKEHQIVAFCSVKSKFELKFS